MAARGVHDHRARRGGPARARPSGRAQQAGAAWRAGELGDGLSHVCAAGGGALDPLEAYSATQSAVECRAV
jgi:hypothetical protein